VRRPLETARRVGTARGTHNRRKSIGGMPGMRLIAVEEHVLPRDIVADLAIDPSSLLGRADEAADLGERRLQIMDAAGIDVQVLSAIGRAIQNLEPARSLAVSRDLNDRMAATVAAHPDRFRFFATLPMSDPGASADELARAALQPGCVGAMIHGQTRGAFLDHPSVEPVLAAAERLKVPIYLHPAPPPPAVRAAYFSDLAPAVADALATFAWGWHAECGMHVLRMVVNGTFERHPGLQLIVGHMGENLPFSLAGYTTFPPLLCAMLVLGVDRIMFSVDYPFSASSEATRFLREAPLSPIDKEKIAHANAERLLGV
jgi:predicted TIM-barrel fold metal-dependent hydrolase